MDPTINVHAKLTQDRIIARLQQPYSLDCIPVETEYQVSCVGDMSDLALYIRYEFGTSGIFTCAISRCWSKATVVPCYDLSHTL